MDAHAHLLSLGWAGPGYALDARPASHPYKQKGHRGLAYDPKSVRSSSTGQGLVQPLLISHRQNKYGIGRKKHESAQGDQWWLDGFEKALDNVGKTEDERDRGSGTATPEHGIGHNAYQGRHAGLYRFFIKGQKMSGTIGEEQRDLRKSNKRKSAEISGGTGSSSDGRSDIDLGPRRQREPTSADFEKVGAFFAARDKHARRRLKAEESDEVGQFEQVGQFLKARSKSEKRSKYSKSPPRLAQSSGKDSTTTVTETKEQRRERRRRRKEERAAMAARDEETATESFPINDRLGNGHAVEEEIARAARKAERRRRKAESRD